jgi:hypothetical protein
MLFTPLLEVSGLLHSYSIVPSQKKPPVLCIGWDAVWSLYNGEETSSRNQTLLAELVDCDDLLTNRYAVLLILN